MKRREIFRKLFLPKTTQVGRLLDHIVRPSCVDVAYCYTNVTVTVVSVSCVGTTVTCAKTAEPIVSWFSEQTSMEPCTRWIPDPL